MFAGELGDGEAGTLSLKTKVSFAEHVEMHGLAHADSFARPYSRELEQVTEVNLFFHESSMSKSVEPEITEDNSMSKEASRLEAVSIHEKHYLQDGIDIPCLRVETYKVRIHASSNCCTGVPFCISIHTHPTRGLM